MICDLWLFVELIEMVELVELIEMIELVELVEFWTLGMWFVKKNLYANSVYIHEIFALSVNNEAITCFMSKYNCNIQLLLIFVKLLLWLMEWLNLSL